MTRAPGYLRVDANLTVSQWATVLKTVRYQNTLYGPGNPTAGIRVASMTLHDGIATSIPVRAQVNVAGAGFGTKRCRHRCVWAGLMCNAFSVVWRPGPSTAASEWLSFGPGKGFPGEEPRTE